MRAGRTKEYIDDVLLRWIISFVLFTLAYMAMLKKVDDYKPSGHFASGLVAQANHSSYYLFIKKHDNESYSDLDIERPSKRSNWKEIAALIVFTIF